MIANPEHCTESRCPLRGAHGEAMRHTDLDKVEIELEPDAPETTCYHPTCPYRLGG